MLGANIYSFSHISKFTLLNFVFSACNKLESQYFWCFFSIKLCPWLVYAQFIPYLCDHKTSIIPLLKSFSDDHRCSSRSV